MAVSWEDIPVAGTAPRKPIEVSWDKIPLAQAGPSGPINFEDIPVAQEPSFRQKIAELIAGAPEKINEFLGLNVQPSPTQRFLEKVSPL